jgi:NAD(P)-dependent dehydrogenase (short-subunit alcohol dehydrogenase family)
MHERKHEAVMVTGGAVRVGRAISIALNEAGYDLVIQYRDSGQAAEELTALIREAGGQAVALPLDLAEIQEIPSWFDRAQREMSVPIVGLVNCAARFQRSTSDEKDMLSHFQINSVAPYLLSLQLSRRLQSGLEGSVVNITDGSIYQPASGFSGYYASKGALEALTYALAKELSPSVRVNAVAPGLVVPRKGKDETFFAQQAGKLPLERTGSAQDVAGAVVYLMGARFVTGEVIRVDGGSHLL